MLAHNYFKYYYKVIAIDKETISARCLPESNKSTQFTANLNRARQTAIYLIIEEAKGTVLYFSQGTVRVL